MASQTNGEAAVFPVYEESMMGYLTKRELFAAIIMGHLAPTGLPPYDVQARIAVSMTDALIRELQKRPV